MKETHQRASLGAVVLWHVRGNVFVGKWAVKFSIIKTSDWEQMSLDHHLRTDQDVIPS